MSTEQTPQKNTPSIALGSGGIQLTNLDEAWRFANMIVKAGMAPKAYENKPEAVLIAMQLGMELGISPMASVQSITVINGIPTVYGDAVKALVISNSVCEYIKESFEGETPQAFKATCISKRKGQDPVTTIVTWADIVRAGLDKKAGDMYSKFPKRMLMFKARNWNLRDNFPEVLKGFKIYEDVIDYEDLSKPAEPKAVEKDPAKYNHLKNIKSQPEEVQEAVVVESTTAEPSNLQPGEQTALV